MEASDICLLIDNTQLWLATWLNKARSLPQGFNAETAEHFFRCCCVHQDATLRAIHSPEPYKVVETLLDLLTQRIDWQEVADHYNTKVREGASC
jgi:hypothetical protein